MSDCHIDFWFDVFSGNLNTNVFVLVNKCFGPIFYPSLFGWLTRVCRKQNVLVFGNHLFVKIQDVFVSVTHVFVINNNFLFLVIVCLAKTKSSCLWQTRVCQNQKHFVFGTYAFVRNKNFLFVTNTRLCNTTTFWFGHIHVCPKQQIFVFDKYAFVINHNFSFWPNTRLP